LTVVAVAVAVVVAVAEEAVAASSTYPFDLWTEDNNTNDVFCVVVEEEEMKNYDWWYSS
jgi:hypothetical protein